MSRQTNKLSTTAVKMAKPRDKAFKMADGGGDHAAGAGLGLGHAEQRDRDNGEQNGDRYMVAIPPPRHIMVLPDEWPVRVARRWRCRWLLLRRWWTRATR